MLATLPPDHLLVDQVDTEPLPDHETARVWVAMPKSGTNSSVAVQFVNQGGAPRDKNKPVWRKRLGDNTLAYSVYGMQKNIFEKMQNNKYYDFCILKEEITREFMENAIKEKESSQLYETHIDEEPVMQGKKGTVPKEQKTSQLQIDATEAVSSLVTRTSTNRFAALSEELSTMGNATTKNADPSNDDGEKQSPSRSATGSGSPKEEAAGAALKKRGGPGSTTQPPPPKRPTTRRGRKVPEEKSQRNGNSMEIKGAPTATTLSPLKTDSETNGSPKHSRTASSVSETKTICSTARLGTLNSSSPGAQAVTQNSPRKSAGPESNHEVSADLKTAPESTSSQQHHGQPARPATATERAERRESAQAKAGTIDTPMSENVPTNYPEFASDSKKRKADDENATVSADTHVVSKADSPRPTPSSPSAADPATPSARQSFTDASAVGNTHLGGSCTSAEVIEAIADMSAADYDPNADKFADEVPLTQHALKMDRIAGTGGVEEEFTEGAKMAPAVVAGAPAGQAIVIADECRGGGKGEVKEESFTTLKVDRFGNLPNPLTPEDRGPAGSMGSSSPSSPTPNGLQCPTWSEPLAVEQAQLKQMATNPYALFAQKDRMPPVEEIFEEGFPRKSRNAIRRQQSSAFDEEEQANFMEEDAFFEKKPAPASELLLKEAEGERFADSPSLPQAASDVRVEPAQDAGEAKVAVIDHEEAADALKEGHEDAQRYDQGNKQTWSGAEERRVESLAYVGIDVDTYAMLQNELDNKCDQLYDSIRRLRENYSAKIAMAKAASEKGVQQEKSLTELESRRNFLAKYEIYGDQLLGRGSHGSVFRGIRYADELDVAIKIINRDREREEHPDALACLDREVQILSNLNHPHIPTLLDYYNAGPRAYLVMEFKRGLNLRELLEHRADAAELKVKQIAKKAKGKVDVDEIRDARARALHMPEAEAKVVLRQLLNVVHYLHVDLKIMHRDLKLENVLLGNDGDGTSKITLLDFGLAIDLSNVGETSDLHGQPEYHAPEYYSEGRIGLAADIWAVGVLFYRLLTGQFPCSRKDRVMGCWMIEPLKSVDVTLACIEFFEALFVVDKMKRMTVSDLLDHRYLKPSDVAVANAGTLEEASIRKRKADRFSETKSENGEPIPEVKKQKQTKQTAIEKKQPTWGSQPDPTKNDQSKSLTCKADSEALGAELATLRKRLDIVDDPEKSPHAMNARRMVVTRSNEIVTRMRAKIVKLEAENKTLTERIAQLEAAANANSSSHSEMVEILQAHLDRAYGHLDVVNKQLEGLLKEGNGWKDEKAIAHCEQEKNSLNMKIEGLRGQIAKLQASQSQGQTGTPTVGAVQPPASVPAAVQTQLQLQSSSLRSLGSGVQEPHPVYAKGKGAEQRRRLPRHDGKGGEQQQHVVEPKESGAQHQSQEAHTPEIRTAAPPSQSLPAVSVPERKSIQPAAEPTTSPSPPRSQPVVATPERTSNSPPTSRQAGEKRPREDNEGLREGGPFAGGLTPQAAADNLVEQTLLSAAAIPVPKRVKTQSAQNDSTSSTSTQPGSIHGAQQASAAWPVVPAVSASASGPASSLATTLNVTPVPTSPVVAKTLVSSVASAQKNEEETSIGNQSRAKTERPAGADDAAARGTEMEKVGTPEKGHDGGKADSVGAEEVRDSDVLPGMPSSFLGLPFKFPWN